MRDRTRETVRAMAGTAKLMQENLERMVVAEGLTKKERDEFASAIWWAAHMRSRLELVMDEDTTEFKQRVGGTFECEACGAWTEKTMMNDKYQEPVYCPACGRRRRG